MNKVLIVAQHIPPHIGGIENIIDHEIKALVAQGREITVVASSIDKNLRSGVSSSYGKNVRIIRVPCLHFLERWFSIPYPIFLPGMLSVLWREIKKTDIIHVHASLCMMSLPALIFARFQKCPSILTEHVVFAQCRFFQLSWILEQIGMNTVGRLCAILSTRIVAYNNRVLKLMEKLSCTTHKSLFLPYLIDRDFFHPPTIPQRISARKALGWEDERIKVLFLGRLIVDKGIFHLAMAKDTAFDIIFCGPGSDEMRRQLKRLGATVLAERNPEQVRELYHAADLVVIPSCREGFPLVAKEALATGLKVVMAYDMGYEPYRCYSNLTFCKRNSQSIRASILHAISREDKKSQMHLANSVDENTPLQWITKLYGGLGNGLAHAN